MARRLAAVAVPLHAGRARGCLGCSRMPPGRWIAGVNGSRHDCSCGLLTHGFCWSCRLALRAPRRCRSGRLVAGVHCAAAQDGADEVLGRVVAVDSATVRAHRRGRGPAKVAPADKPRDHTLGRSRGGLTTKIHLAADGRATPGNGASTASSNGVAWPPAMTRPPPSSSGTHDDPKGRPWWTIRDVALFVSV